MLEKGEMGAMANYQKYNFVLPTEPTDHVAVCSSQQFGLTAEPQKGDREPSETTEKVWMTRW